MEYHLEQARHPVQRSRRQPYHQRYSKGQHALNPLIIIVGSEGGTVAILEDQNLLFHMEGLSRLPCKASIALQGRQPSIAKGNGSLGLPMVVGIPQGRDCLAQYPAKEFALFVADEHPQSRNERLMGTLNAINRRYGRGVLKLAAEGFEKPWQMRRGNLSPRYTTEWAG